MVSRFKVKLVKMTKDVNGRFDDYSILLKIRQILLHCGYELVKNDNLFFIHMTMSYYFFNVQELLQKQKNKYQNCGGKEKAAEYHLKNKGVLNENARNQYRNLSEEDKEGKGEYAKNRHKKKKNG